eukprot:CAMPEP_0203996848 /NCGR_PEP_ID=MMETSP0360-20130528/13000_1 /ASSEMBLY_ACC=CAM_ASM_000342 /TAXON_ID=268821 /ORGANISM="Scrippsiella Hangoei, Strain SHTV-5" /LENGTH=31 /DNA_ID= /DNA_START= /DNA_END= /DNA_ORIENTATION=
MYVPERRCRANDSANCATCKLEVAEPESTFD